jgi:hypothetical protein
MVKDEQLTSSTAPFVCASCPFFLAQQRPLCARGRPCVRSSFRAVGSSSPTRGPSLQSSTAVAVPAFGCRAVSKLLLSLSFVLYKKSLFRIVRKEEGARERQSGAELREASS